MNRLNKVYIIFKYVLIDEEYEEERLRPTHRRPVKHYKPKPRLQSKINYKKEIKETKSTKENHIKSLIKENKETQTKESIVKESNTKTNEKKEVKQATTPSPEAKPQAQPQPKVEKQAEKPKVAEKARFVQQDKRRRRRNIVNQTPNQNPFELMNDEEETNQNTFMGSRIKDPPMFSSFMSTKENIKFNKNMFDSLIKKSESFNLETQRRGRYN